MNGGKVLDRVEIELRDYRNGDTFVVHADVFDNSLSKKWLSALNDILKKDLHLEKNYCFLGFASGQRDGQFILDQVNKSITAINGSDLGYEIDDRFDMKNCITPGEIVQGGPGGRLVHAKLNWLHRYFEDLQGVSGHMSPYAQKASPEIKWHIRQLNLLCHEFETWAMSWRQSIVAPAWQRPSQLMCWLNAPRFILDEEDYNLFGIETLNRPLGGVFVGVNKAVGKTHWEVFNDEGSSVEELVTTTMRPQTEAAGDFDIEWANNPGDFPWQQKKVAEFRTWLIDNGFDPEDPFLTIGHPQVGQVDLAASFGTQEYASIWAKLNNYLDVVKITTSDCSAVYDYHWSQDDYMKSQIDRIQKGN